MTIFELVKIALDELYTEGTQLYGPKLDEQITRDLKYRSKSYERLTDPSRKPLDYEDPARRFAYVYKYVAAHGDYLVQVLEKLAAKRGAIFDKPSLRVSCLGGGPGSDIIAVLKYLDEHKHEPPVEKLTCYLLDQEQAWADIWTELNESLTSKVAVNVNFQPLDITDADSWKSQKTFLQADLLTMIYFVSEVFSLDQTASLKSLGAIFLIARRAVPCSCMSTMGTTSSPLISTPSGRPPSWRAYYLARMRDGLRDFPSRRRSWVNTERSSAKIPKFRLG